MGIPSMVRRTRPRLICLGIEARGAAIAKHRGELKGSLLIFDSSRAPGEGGALYLSADAELVDDTTVEDSLAPTTFECLSADLASASTRSCANPRSTVVTTR